MTDDEPVPGLDALVANPPAGWMRWEGEQWTPIPAPPG